MNGLFDAIAALPAVSAIGLVLALLVAFGFEFVNGFHDTANAVTTVIYTHTLKPRLAVIYSGICNFIGVVAGGTAVAFSVVHLLPTDVLLQANTRGAIVMTMSLLLAGLIWNLGTWYFGLPVSSSHTLIGSILGVALVNSLLKRGDLSGVNWEKAGEVVLSLLVSPAIGFIGAALLLWISKTFLPDAKLYEPPVGETPPPTWIRGLLFLTCGGVSFAHGSNDGQKGMGLILLILIGFLPGYYAMNLHESGTAPHLYESAQHIRQAYEKQNVAMTSTAKQDLALIESDLRGKRTLAEIQPERRWQVREAIYRLSRGEETAPDSSSLSAATASDREALRRSVEYVPLWVIFGVALSLGAGTMIGYQRIVVTLAEKIGKTHLSYAQGAAAEVTAMLTIFAATGLGLPVSTTHVLSSGIAGTMWANRSGVQRNTVQKIAAAWMLTLPMSTALSGGLYLPATRLFL